MKKNIILIAVLVSFLSDCILYAQIPTPSPEFWEKVETNIFGNKSYVPKKLEEIQTPNTSYTICDNGLMVLTFGTFTGTVNQQFVSTDNGKSWKVLIKSRHEISPKYEPYAGVFSDGNTLISDNLAITEKIVLFNQATVLLGQD